MEYSVALQTKDKRRNRNNRCGPGSRYQTSEQFHSLGVISNQNMLSLLREGTIQAKLTIGQPNDKYEQEADRVADHVMRMPSSSFGRAEERLSIRQMCGSCTNQVRRQPAPGEEELEEYYHHPSRLSMKAVRPSATISHASLGLEADIRAMRGHGSPMKKDALSFFQPRLGYDFGQVRIHTGAQAAALTNKLGARAFTLGKDIFFATGQYAPHTNVGRHLMAHELTHVVQQRGGVQRVMRACSCSGIGRTPTAAQKRSMHVDFPHLDDNDWCITDAPTSTYNCYAWSVGNNRRWIDREIDRVHGNNNGRMEISDFDAFYRTHGYVPRPNMTPINAEIAIYGNNASDVKHAARVSNARCNSTVMFESKLGNDYRMIHPVLDMEGPLYGRLLQYYVRSR